MNAKPSPKAQKPIEIRRGNASVKVYTGVNRAGSRVYPQFTLAYYSGNQRIKRRFADTLRTHKHELLDWFEAQVAGPPPDRAPWLHVARQILAGEFDGADKSTARSLTIGLRSVLHPACQQALNRLERRPRKP